MIGFSVLGALLVAQASQPAHVVTISDAELARAPRLTIAREPVWRVGGEAEGPYSFTFIVGATFMRAGRLALLEVKPPQVHVFDAGGHHQLTFGRLGSGPGEFSMVQRLLPHVSDSIVVSQVGRVSVFDNLGKHGRTFETVNAGAGLALVHRMLPDGSMLATGTPMPTPELARERLKQPAGIRNDSSRLVVLNARANHIATDFGRRKSGYKIIVRLNDTTIVTATPAFAPGMLIDAADSLVLLTDGATASLEVLSARTAARLRAIRFDLPRRPVTAEDRAAFVRSKRNTEDVLKVMPYPDFMPYFDLLHVSYDGVVRLRRYVTRRDSRAQWLSFTRMGQFLSVVDVPAKARVLDFDRDRVLVVERDADDLEYLALYKLIPSKR